MFATYNYIDDTEKTFLEDASFAALGDLWNSADTLSVDPFTNQDPEFGSLKLTSGVTSSLTYNIWSTPATDVPSQYAITSPVIDNSDVAEVFCWLRPTEHARISINTTLTKVSFNSGTGKFMLSTDPNDVISGDSASHTVEVGTTDERYWHLLRSMPVRIPDGDDQYSIGFEVSVEYLNPLAVGTLNLSRPTIIRAHAILDNQLLIDCARVIPRTFLEQDGLDLTDNKVSYPLLRLIDTCTRTASLIYDKYQKIEYVDVSDGFDETALDTYSELISPQITDGDELSWLAQFRGRELVVTYEPSTDGEPWELFILDESLLDDPDVLSTTTVGTTSFGGGAEEYFKWQVETGNYGHNAGTLNSLLESIKFLLTGTKTINYTLGANTIHFETKIGETFGGDLLSIGDESPYVLKIVEPARPLGLSITHELIA